MKGIYCSRIKEGQILFGLAPAVVFLYAKSSEPYINIRLWPIERTPAIDIQQKSIYFHVLFYRTFFIYSFFPAELYQLGFGLSLPFCAEKRSSLLHESEGIFVVLLGKQSFRRHESTTVIVVSHGNFAWQHMEHDSCFPSNHPDLVIYTCIKSLQFQGSSITKRFSVIIYSKLINYYISRNHMHFTIWKGKRLNIECGEKSTPLTKAQHTD